MKRTLLAVGFAVLISMMLVPQGNLYGPYFLTRTERIVCYCPFFLDLCTNQHFLPRAFVLQTIFLAVLAAVIVNLFRRKPKTPHPDAKVGLPWLIVGLLVGLLVVLLVIASFVINYFSQPPPVLSARSAPPAPSARPGPPARASSENFRQVDVSLVEPYNFTLNDSGFVEGWIRNKSSVPIDAIDFHVEIKNFAGDTVSSETQTVTTQIPPSQARHISFTVSSSPAQNKLFGGSSRSPAMVNGTKQVDLAEYLAKHGGNPSNAAQPPKPTAPRSRPRSPFDLFDENDPFSANPQFDPSKFIDENGPGMTKPYKPQWSWNMKIEAAGTNQR